MFVADIVAEKILLQLRYIELLLDVARE